jgi:hypothetical protein
MAEISPETKVLSEQIADLCHGAQDKMAIHEKKKAALLSTFGDIRAIVDRSEKLALSMDEEAGHVMTGLSAVRHRSEEIRGLRVPTAVGLVLVLAASISLGAAPAEAPHQETPMSVRDVLIGQADALVAVGSHRQALRVYARANLDHGTEADTLAKIGDCHLHLGELPLATAACDQAIGAEPAHGKAHTVRGLCLLEMAGKDKEKVAEAVRELEYGDAVGKRVAEKYKEPK